MRQLNPNLPEPLEDEEQIRVVQQLELWKLKHTAIPNSTYTTSWKQKQHNADLGLHAGFPDLIILVMPNQAYDGLGHLLVPEMKRQRTFKVSESQKEWIAALNGLKSVNIESVVAHGADEALEWVEGFLK